MLHYLSPNIQIQVLKTDLQTFPKLISSENLFEDQSVFHEVITSGDLLKKSEDVLRKVAKFCRLFYGGGNNFATPFFLARVRRITFKLCKFTYVKGLFLAAFQRIFDK